MAAGATQISAESPNISIGPEIDMNYLEELAAKYKLRVPDDAWTSRDFAAMTDQPLWKAREILRELYNGGELQRKQVGKEYYYWENDNE